MSLCSTTAATAGRLLAERVAPDLAHGAAVAVVQRPDPHHPARPDARGVAFGRHGRLVTSSRQEGTVTFGEGTFTLHPEKGHYKGHTGTRPLDRPMTAEERKASTYRWEWRNEDGKRQLYIGPDTKILSRFKRAE